VPHAALASACAAIIPLGPGSRQGSSSLPEGCSLLRLAPKQRERVHHNHRREAGDCENADSTSRAGSPLLFGLAPRGVFRASRIAARAVGSYPTFSPLPANRAKTSCRFSCAMPPCRSPAGNVLRRTSQRSPGSPASDILPDWGAPSPSFLRM
jgi:hypothetical protein